MKANEALSILRVTRPTLARYVKEGKIKVTVLPTGRYDYDEESIYKFQHLNRKKILLIKKNY